VFAACRARSDLETKRKRERGATFFSPKRMKLSAVVVKTWDGGGRTYFTQ
jgi:hypothetical protein